MDAIDHLYHYKEGQVTPQELEEYKHNIPTFTPRMRSWLLKHFENLPVPDADEKELFLQREPALGATVAILDEVRTHNEDLPAVQQRILFHILRSKMLRQLISCSGARTTDDLLDILQAELDDGIAAPVPKWYEFKEISFGPSRIGYEHCGASGCYRTETTRREFQGCPKCKMVYYCCKRCQDSDWKNRHKMVCQKTSGTWREQMGQISSMFIWGRSNS